MSKCNHCGSEFQPHSLHDDAFTALIDSLAEVGIAVERVHSDVSTEASCSQKICHSCFHSRLQSTPGLEFMASGAPAMCADVNLPGEPDARIKELEDQLERLRQVLEEKNGALNASKVLATSQGQAAPSTPSQRDATPNAQQSLVNNSRSKISQASADRQHEAEIQEYKDRIAYLESEIARLQVQILSKSEAQMHNSTSRVSQAETDNPHQAEVQELKDRIATLESEIARLQVQILSKSEAQIHNSTSRVSQAENDSQHQAEVQEHKDRIATLESEIARLQVQIMSKSEAQPREKPNYNFRGAGVSEIDMNFTILEKLESFFEQESNIPEEIEQFLSLRELDASVRHQTKLVLEQANEQLTVKVLMLLQNFCEELEKKGRQLDALSGLIRKGIQDSKIMFMPEEVEASLEVIQRKRNFVNEALENMRECKEPFQTEQQSLREIISQNSWN